MSNRALGPMTPPSAYDADTSPETGEEGWS